MPNELRKSGLFNVLQGKFREYSKRTFHEKFCMLGDAERVEAARCEVRIILLLHSHAPTERQTCSLGR